MIPIMVQSARCRLKGNEDKDKTRAGECVFDQVGVVSYIVAAFVPSLTLPHTHVSAEPGRLLHR
jgi:hypothetical protein